jgi:glucose/arabinose dehydrogenase/cytochrome c5
MKNVLFYAGILTLIAICLGCQPESEKKLVLPAADSDNGGITLPNGFGALSVVDSLGRARHLAVRDNGDIFVKMRGADSPAIIALRDTDGDGKADRQESWGEYSGTGMHIHNGYLYASSDTVVYRYKLKGEELLPEATPEVMVTGFINQRSHATKSLAFDGAGNMYVNIGAPSNACQEEARTAGSPGMDPCPQLERQAGIWKFSDSKPGQTQQGDGTRYASGIRNSVALAWNKAQNSLYALQHGRDQLSGLWGEMFTNEQNAELPAEEFLQIDEGDDFGWPYCYYDQFQEKKVLAPEYGGDGKEQGRCEGVKPPIIGFPGHMAPNDLLFYTGNQFPEKYRNGAFIAFHGSWNRAPLPQEGYYVVFVPMKDGQPAGDWEVFAENFSQLDEVKNPRDAVYRPMGLAQGPDGSLYISDSQKGKIWRVMYNPEQAAVAEKESAAQTDAESNAQEVVLTEAEQALADNGKAVYNTYCLSCHMEDGGGVPGMNPPLSHTDWVNGDKERLIKVVLNGLSDPIEINGETYSNVMAPHSDLSDKEIASVLTFVRNNFGNSSGAVSVEEVATVRANNKE